MLSGPYCGGTRRMKGELADPHSGFFTLLQRPVSDWYGEFRSQGLD